MNCGSCGGKAKKNGHDTTGRQRYWCSYCWQSFGDGHLKHPRRIIEKVEMIRASIASHGIRGTARLLGVDQNTVMKIKREYEGN
jgi:transposase-like protein